MSKSNFTIQLKNISKKILTKGKKPEIEFQGDNNKRIKRTRPVIFSRAIFTQKDVKMWIVKRACIHFKQFKVFN